MENPSRLQEYPTKVETTAAEHDKKEKGEHLQLICKLHFPSTPLIADNAQVPLKVSAIAVIMQCSYECQGRRSAP